MFDFELNFGLGGFRLVVEIHCIKSSFTQDHHCPILKQD